MGQAAQERRPGKGFALLGGLGLGALVMYLADPQSGRRRRALLRDQATHAAAKAQHGADVALRDARNRLHGLGATARQWREGRESTPDDVVLMERVRAALGRVTSHPHAIQIGAHEGHVVVSGVALSHESDAILACIRKVPGVRSLEHHLDLHEAPGRIPSLQGGVNRERRPELMQDNWSPAWRSLAGVIGAGLAIGGWIRGGIAGLTVGGLGGALAARAATNRNLKSLVGMGPGGAGSVVHKTIHIDAPVEEVYRHWSIESFPRWMSHVREVRPVGDNRHRWIVDGPAGVPVEWEAQTTSTIEHEEIAWRSIPGSTVDNAGRVRFTPENGGTRVQVTLSYVPPGGVVGHAVARALGADPKSRMDDDLMRFKSMIETGRLPHDAAASRRLPPGPQPSM